MNKEEKEQAAIAKKEQEARDKAFKAKLKELGWNGIDLWLLKSHQIGIRFLKLSLIHVNQILKKNDNLQGSFYLEC